MQAFVDRRTFPEADATLIVSNQLSEMVLAGFFMMMDRDGLLPIVYHQALPTLRNWLEWHANPEHIWLACAIERGLGDSDLVHSIDLCGMAWVNAVEQRGPAVRVGEVGHCFLPAYQGFLTPDVEIPRTFVEMALRYVFGRTGITLLVGTTPVPNRAAIRFISKCGFSQTGVIEGYTSWQGKPCGAVLSWMSQESWELQEQRKASSEQKVEVTV